MTAYESYTDEQLLPLLKSGNDAAFTEIYNRYWKLLFSVAANKLNELMDAEEVVQEVFADVWNRRVQIQIETSLKSYLAASVKYRCYTLMALRQKEKKQIENFSTAYAAQSLSPQKQLEAKELFSRLQQRAATLPEKCRLVYELSRGKGFSNKKIAEALQVSEKAVEANITRALRHLKGGLEVVIFFFILL